MIERVLSRGEALEAPVRGAARLLHRARRRDPIDVVVCLDVEPDLRLVSGDEPTPWRGFERYVERLPQLRRRLSAITGSPAAFNWFVRMDLQIAETWGSAAWAADAYAGTLAELAREGDEIGVHVHAW